MITTDGLAGLLETNSLTIRKGISDWNYNHKLSPFLEFTEETIQKLSTDLFFRYCHIDNVCILEETDAEDTYDGLMSKTVRNGMKLSN